MKIIPGSLKKFPFSKQISPPNNNPAPGQGNVCQKMGKNLPEPLAWAYTWYFD